MYGTGTIYYVNGPMVGSVAKGGKLLFHIIFTFYEEMVVYFRAITQVSGSDVARLGEITGVCRHGGCSEGVGELLGSECFERIQTLT